MRPGTDSAEHLLFAIFSYWKQYYQLRQMTIVILSLTLTLIITSGSVIVKLRLSFVDGIQNVSNDHI